MIGPDTLQLCDYMMLKIIQMKIAHISGYFKMDFTGKW